MKKRIISMVLVVSLLMTMLCSCNLFSKKTVEVKNGIPVASGYKNDAEMNTKIEKFYNMIKNQIKDCDGAELVCSVEEHSKGVTLKAQIVKGDVAIDVPNMEITLDGTVRDSEGDLAPYRNGEYLNAALTLKELGMDIDVSKYVEELSTLDAYGMFVNYYDCLMDNDKAEDEDDIKDRAVDLGLAEKKKNISDKYVAQDSLVLEIMVRFLMGAYDDVYGKAEEDVTFRDFFECMKLYYEVHSSMDSSAKDGDAEFIGVLEKYLKEKDLFDEKPTILEALTSGMIAHCEATGYPEGLESAWDEDIHDIAAADGGVEDIFDALAKEKITFETLPSVVFMSNTFTFNITNAEDILDGASDDRTVRVQNGQLVIVIAKINEYLENL